MLDTNPVTDTDTGPVTLDDLDGRNLATAPEAAAILRYDVRTVRSAIAAGDIPARRAPLTGFPLPGCATRPARAREVQRDRRQAPGRAGPPAAPQPLPASAVGSAAGVFGSGPGAGTRSPGGASGGRRVVAAGVHDISFRLVFAKDETRSAAGGRAATHGCEPYHSLSL
jgi:hypothetical protein